MTIPFTQYLLPNGRKRATSIDVDEETKKLAQQFMDAGGYFECEILSTEDISLTACFDQPDGDNDIAVEVVQNGPDVIKAVQKLVRNAVEWLENNV